nr:MAG TPA: hypothetical protein [Caudoviricetes sp.]
MNIERLKKEIDMQTRNGRTEVYIRLEDIKELVDGLEGKYGDNRMLIEADYIEELIAEYEEKHKNSFKESLKVKKPIESWETKLTDFDEKGFTFEPIKEER